MTEPDYERLAQSERDALHYHAIAFDEAFRDVGGRARIEDYSSDQLTNYHEGSFRNFGVQLSTLLRARGSDATIYCDAIASPGVNAVATRVDNHMYFVGINIGTYIRMRRALTMLLYNISMPLEDCDLGPVQYPGTDVATLGYIGKYRADDLLSALDDTSPISEQWSSLRALVASPLPDESRVTDAITCMAIDFILLHECVHIVNGHTALLQQRGLRRLWHRETGTRYAASALLRGCEADADTGAGTILGRALLDGGTGVSLYDFKRDELFYLVAFSIACTFNLFDLSAPSPTMYRATEHAHHELRYLIVVNAIRNGLAEQSKAASDNWRRIEWKAFTDARTAIERMSLGGRAFHYLQPVLPSTQLEAMTSVAAQLAHDSEALLADARAAQDQCRLEFALPVLFRS